MQLTDTDERRTGRLDHTGRTLCRYLTQVQTAQEDDSNTQAALEQILGDQMHLAHSINKLLLLENAVYQ